ncbi:hypothetical protein CDAR_527271 [Caerostris darwini]|uniref:Uncharacterized protein n=1 Tax=Caerostris darwini TaxID=1538125 RepID=A0AAV4WJV4_9ARAC|nr:hypothetical protein CDAR_527271 [Caerostris darwini]
MLPCNGRQLPVNGHSQDECQDLVQEPISYPDSVILSMDGTLLRLLGRKAMRRGGEGEKGRRYRLLNRTENFPISLQGQRFEVVLRGEGMVLNGF